MSAGRFFQEAEWYKRSAVADSGELAALSATTGKSNLIVVACSAGGLNALSHFLSRLPQDFAAPVIVLQHVHPSHRSLLAEILSKRTCLPVHQAREGETVRPGFVYIAPPDRHLLVNRNHTLALSSGKQVNFLRPSADLLFESAAQSYGEGVIAVVLTGTGRDGAAGVRSIKKMEGTVIAQDEKTSEFFGMPAAAIRGGDVDYVLPLDDIAGMVQKLVSEKGT